MNKEPTQAQMINAELVARAKNKSSLKVLKRYIPGQEKDKLKIAFNCECADLDCKSRIKLTVNEYEELHKNHAQFVVSKGHIEPKIESVKHNTKNVTLVEKHALSA